MYTSACKKVIYFILESNLYLNFQESGDDDEEEEEDMSDDDDEVQINNQVLKVSNGIQIFNV